MKIAFTTANYVARETGYAMHGWGHGDRTTNEAFAPIETYAERFDALLADVRALGFATVDVWGAHLNPEWATDAHVDAAREALARHEIDARVAGVGTLRHDRVRPEPADRDLDHFAWVAWSSRASATRYAANLRASRRGSRARTSTPSGWSSRSSIGAPSA